MDLLNKREFCNVVDTENNNGEKYISNSVTVWITNPMGFESLLHLVTL